MTPQQIDLIETSWQQLQTRADDIAPLFYCGLFVLDASIKRLFRSPMHMQEQKLLAMLDTIVTQLRQFDDLLDTVAALGQRHQGYGVQNKHFDLAGEAMLWAIEHCLGDAWTSSVNEAWSAAVDLLVEVMKGDEMRQAA